MNPRLSLEVFVHKVDGDLFLTDEQKIDCQREVQRTVATELVEARRRQRCAEAALVAAKAEALAATMQAHRGKDVDVVAQLREELAACRRQCIWKRLETIERSW